MATLGSVHFSHEPASIRVEVKAGQIEVSSDFDRPAVLCAGDSLTFDLAPLINGYNEAIKAAETA